MGEDEPEPFRMAADDDAGTPDEAGAGAAADDAPGLESLDDLIEEASRTAAEQAVQAALGEAPEDRSADVWGPGGERGGPEADAVWDEAVEAHSGRGVWAATDAGDDVWDVTEDQRRTAGWAVDEAPAPTTADDLEEPEPFAFAVDEGEARLVHAADPVPADDPAEHGDDDVEPFRFAAGPATSAPATVPDHVEAADEEEPEGFAFAVDVPMERDDEGDGVTDEDWDATGEDGAEDAGPRSSLTDAWAPREQETAADDDPWAVPQEPLTLTDEAAADLWAASDESADADEADDLWATTDSSDVTAVDAVAPGGDDGGSGSESGTDDAWTFDVDDETPLAETATPRSDAGWRDLEAEVDAGPGWALEGVTSPADGEDDEDDDAPTSFSIPRDDEEDEDDDAPMTFVIGDDPDWDDDPAEPVDTAQPAASTAPALDDAPGDAAAAAASATAFGSTLDGLLGDRAEQPEADDDAFDALDDLGDLDAFDDLDDLDDLGAAPTPAGDLAAGSTPLGAPPPVADDLLDAPPPSAEDLLAPAPSADADTPVAAEPDDDTPVDDEAVDDTPVDDDAADGSPPPAGLSFSSSAKPAKKRRGLFG